jgi:hypothetical protein
MVADEVNIGKDTVRKIVVEGLQKRNICSCFVPHSLTPEQKDGRTAACSEPDFFNRANLCVQLEGMYVEN